mgnify:CR=1 FL=1
MAFHYLLDYDLLDKMMYSILQSPTDLSYQYLEAIEDTYKTNINWKKYDDFFKNSPYLLDVDLGEHTFVDLEKQYDSFSWDNWNLLDFETYCRRIEL